MKKSILLAIVTVPLMMGDKPVWFIAPFHAANELLIENEPFVADSATALNRTLADCAA